MKGVHVKFRINLYCWPSKLRYIFKRGFYSSLIFFHCSDAFGLFLCLFVQRLRPKGWRDRLGIVYSVHMQNADALFILHPFQIGDRLFKMALAVDYCYEF